MRKPFQLLLLLLILGVQLWLLMNLRFTAWPEMLSYPYLRNNDFLLYHDMIHPYPPLLTMWLSIIYKFFGYDVVVLKTVSWAVSLLSSILVYYVINYVTVRKSLALVTCFGYVLLQPFLEGNMLWFDSVIVPPILAGTYFFLVWIKEKKDVQLILASSLFSVAALTKQTAALFLVFLGVYLLFKKRDIKSLLNIVVPPIFLLSLLVFRLLQEGILQDFLNWTILYPLGEWGDFPGYVQMSFSETQALILSTLIVPILLFYIVRRKLFSDYAALVLFASLVLSLVMVYPRFSFFHFQLSLAFVFILYGYLLKEWATWKSLIFVGAVVLLLYPFVHKPTLPFDWQKETRFYERKDTNLANKIADLTGPDDKVFLLGLHSGIYVMADRVPPKRWTDNFGWYLEIPGVQEEILERWENPSTGSGPPKYVVWRIPNQGNWFDLGVYQPQKIVEYIKNNYNKEGEIAPQIALWKRKGL